MKDMNWLAIFGAICLVTFVCTIVGLILAVINPTVGFIIMAGLFILMTYIHFAKNSLTDDQIKTIKKFSDENFYRRDSENRDS